MFASAKSEANRFEQIAPRVRLAHLRSPDVPATSAISWRNGADRRADVSTRRNLYQRRDGETTRWRFWKLADARASAVRRPWPFTPARIRRSDTVRRAENEKGTGKNPARL